MKRWALRSWLAMLFVAASGCLSPTLPLPPPEAPTSVVQDTTVAGAAGAATRWLVRGGATPGAVVLVRNTATGRIFGVEDVNHDGRYTVAVDATECDLAEVWELVGDITSERTGFIVAPTSNGVVDGGSCAEN